MQPYWEERFLLFYEIALITKCYGVDPSDIFIWNRVFITFILQCLIYWYHLLAIKVEIDIVFGVKEQKKVLKFNVLSHDSHAEHRKNLKNYILRELVGKFCAMGSNVILWSTILDLDKFLGHVMLELHQFTIFDFLTHLWFHYFKVF